MLPRDQFAAGGRRSILGNVSEVDDTAPVGVGITGRVGVAITIDVEVGLIGGVDEAAGDGAGPLQVARNKLTTMTSNHTLFVFMMASLLAAPLSIDNHGPPAWRLTEQYVERDLVRCKAPDRFCPSALFGCVKLCRPGGQFSRIQNERQTNKWGRSSRILASPPVRPATLSDEYCA